MANLRVHNISRVSQLFQPVHLVPKKSAAETEIISTSYKHLTKYGIIKSSSVGMYSLLPLGMRVLNKLTNLVDNEMSQIGAQKMLMPALIQTSLWKKTDRLEDSNTELFRLRDRHKKEYLLGPTHEEAICDLISSVGVLSPKLLPLRLYQISSKWRDEMKPRHGFLRSREFIMKDLYTFDATLDDSKNTYKAVCEAYDKLFQKIGIPFVKALGSTGSIGGIMSHEYHYSCNIGEDIVCVCSSCQYCANKSMCNETHCPQCNSPLSEQNTAEIGHAFLLDTKYSAPLKASYKQNHNVSPLVMGCFGLGLSRIFSVAAEVLSSNDELRWPKCLAPYTVCIIPPKAGSKEEGGSQYVNEIIEMLQKLEIDVILDDRTELTIGHRLVYARATGFPYIVVIGKSSIKSTPLFEIHNVNDSKHCDVPLDGIYNYFTTESISN